MARPSSEAVSRQDRCARADIAARELERTRMAVAQEHDRQGLTLVFDLLTSSRLSPLSPISFLPHLQNSKVLN